MDPFSSLNGTSVPLCVHIHGIPSYVSVSNYQSTTIQYRTKMPSPFSLAVINLFFDVHRVYTLKHRFMVIPRTYIGIGNSWVRCIRHALYRCNNSTTSNAVRNERRSVCRPYPTLPRFLLFTKRYRRINITIYYLYYTYIVVHGLSSQKAFPCCVRVPRKLNTIIVHIRQCSLNLIFKNSSVRIVLKRPTIWIWGVVRFN